MLAIRQETRQKTHQQILWMRGRRTNVRGAASMNCAGARQQRHQALAHRQSLGQHLRRQRQRSQFLRRRQLMVAV